MTCLLTLIGDRTRSLEHFVRKNAPADHEVIRGLEGSTYPEKLYRHLYPEANSICECGKPLAFMSFRQGFREYCGVKCMVNSAAVRARTAATVQERYGKDHFSKTPQYRERYESTCLKRYGVTNAGAAEHILAKKAKRKQDSFIDKLCVSKNVKFLGDQYSGVRQSTGQSAVYSFLCNVCEYGFQQTVLNGLYCPRCEPTGHFGGPSRAETEIADWIENLGISIHRNSRSIIPPKELDIYVPSHLLAVEYCGHYWHSDRRLAPDYHLEKMKLCEAKGLTLITIFEDDWLTKRHIVQARLLAQLGMLSRTTSARKTQVCEIDNPTYRDFVELHHSQGFAAARVKLGLFDQQENLVAVMSFSPTRYGSKPAWEMIRFCTMGAVPGGAGKLFSHFRKRHQGEACVSYADRRYSQGKLYRQLGFEEMGETRPNYWYIPLAHTALRHHRLQYTKKRLVSRGYCSTKTEKQIMIERGYARIYDCGSLIFRMTM